MTKGKSSQRKEIIEEGILEQQEEQEGRKNNGMNSKVSTDYPSLHDFYKSYLMIETKIKKTNSY